MYAYIEAIGFEVLDLTGVSTRSSRNQARPQRGPPSRTDNVAPIDHGTQHYAQLAEQAATAESRQTYVDLAHSWRRLAAELENVQSLLSTINGMVFDLPAPNEIETRRTRGTGTGYPTTS